MARDLTAGMQAEVVAPLLRPVVFLEGQFASGTLRLWTGVGQIDWNGFTWTGGGNLLGISEITETPDVRAVGITVSLSGMPAAVLSAVLGQARQGLPLTIYVGAMDAAGAVIATPYRSYQGRLDVPSIEDAGEKGIVAIAYESRLIDLERPRARRWTHEDAQIDTPGERGFEYISGLANREVYW